MGLEAAGEVGSSYSNLTSPSITAFEVEADYSWARGTVPTPFGVACAGLLVPGGARRVSLTRGRRHWPRRFHGRASYTRLKGVSAARRKRVKPAAVTTSLILASPAWAPSASPTSWDSEAGVHSSVENA